MLNSTLKVRTMRMRDAPSVFNTTASCIRLKRVLAMLDARIVNPARIRKSRPATPHHKRNLVHHAFDALHIRPQHFDDGDRGIRREECALHVGNLLGIDMQRRHTKSPARLEISPEGKTNRTRAPRCWPSAR